MAEKVKCTIVSGAPNECSEFIKNSIDKDSFIIAADSGYKQLVKAGITPDLIIADFDSSERPVLDCEIIKIPVEKDTGDTFACVKYAVSDGYKEIEILNALGSRFDHSFANILCLDYCRKNGVKCSLKDAHNRISLITDTYTFKKEYDFFSLFAFLEDCKGVKIEGAYYTSEWYSKDSLDIKQGDQFGLGNYITDGECTVSLEKGTLILIESND